MALESGSLCPSGDLAAAHSHLGCRTRVSPLQEKWQEQEYRRQLPQDGRWVYFCSNRTGDDQVWKMPATGGDAVQMTREGGRAAQESVEAIVPFEVEGPRFR